MRAAADTPAPDTSDSGSISHAYFPAGSWTACVQRNPPSGQLGSRSRTTVAPATSNTTGPLPTTLFIDFSQDPSLRPSPRLQRPRVIPVMVDFPLIGCGPS